MDLLVIRHAIAGDREEWARTGRPDNERPITDEGRTAMQENARALRALVPKLEVLATSPYVRAVETAEVVREAFGEIEVVHATSLAHGGAPEAVSAWLAGRSEARIGIVGHEPDLGQLASWFLSGTVNGGLSLKKGGACLLRFHSRPAQGAAELKWLLPPKILRRLVS
jgi:phosphohistidine phosphatase